MGLIRLISGSSDTVFQITIAKLRLGELVYKHKNSLLPRIYDSYFENVIDVHRYPHVLFEIQPKWAGFYAKIKEWQT